MQRWRAWWGSWHPACEPSSRRAGWTRGRSEEASWRSWSWPGVWACCSHLEMLIWSMRPFFKSCWVTKASWGWALRYSWIHCTAAMCWVVSTLSVTVAMAFAACWAALCADFRLTAMVEQGVWDLSPNHLHLWDNWAQAAEHTTWHCMQQWTGSTDVHTMLAYIRMRIVCSMCFTPVLDNWLKHVVKPKGCGGMRCKPSLSRTKHVATHIITFSTHHNTSQASARWVAHTHTQFETGCYVDVAARLPTWVV